jgi:hypothetical protein
MQYTAFAPSEYNIFYLFPFSNLQAKTPRAAALSSIACITPPFFAEYNFTFFCYSGGV